MPTSHVLPETGELLQEIADALWKAKKVLVVTGAGISTNSGIPDFRSKNGLYSLIQAQFEAAAAADNEGASENEEDEPPMKRRRLSYDNLAEVNEETKETKETNDKREANDPQSKIDDDSRADATIHVATGNQEDREGDTIQCAPSCGTIDRSRTIVVELPSLNSRLHGSSPATPQRHDQVELPTIGASILCQGDDHTPALKGIPPLPQSSSPLSSPPPILFDPDEEYGAGSTTSGRSSNSSLAASCSSSDSESETDETPCSSQPTLSSQSSFSSGRLPVMKGRELFDASIWADPVKTSVFYTFATTLRQKVRDVVPTRSHQFISHLRDTGKLVRCYTQNIDEIEEKVGLTTSLVLGPGKKGRFSRRSVSRASTGLSDAKDEQLQKDQDDSRSQGLPSSQTPQTPQASQDVPSTQESQDPQGSQSDEGAEATAAGPKKLTANRDPHFRGVECVFLHGSLRQLRCFRCGQTTPWDEHGRENETLSGRQPSCPRCEGATAAREGRGKRALAVGKLRPDIVLYGEEHPNAHLISPIVQHDISLAPDMLLILGTSLKVHGLKVLIREFSKAVHSRGGKVVFVNFTKPPESVWSEIIDYWVQWDCDAWVQDLKKKKPVMWLPPGSVAEEPKKRRKSLAGAPKGKRRSNDDTTQTPQEGGDEVKQEHGEQLEERKELGKGRKKKAKKEKEDKPGENSGETPSEKLPDVVKKEVAAKAVKVGGRKRTERALNPNAKYPAAVRDDKANGAYSVWKIRRELKQATGQPVSPKRKIARTTSAATAATKKRKPRHSAPAALESTNTQVQNDENIPPAVAKQPTELLPSPVQDAKNEHQTPTGKPIVTFSSPLVPKDYSILSAVKANSRQRRTKKIFEGGSVSGPVVVQAQTTEPRRKQTKKPKARSSISTEIYSDSIFVPSAPVHSPWMGTDRLVERLTAELRPLPPSLSSPARLQLPPLEPAAPDGLFNSSPPTFSPRPAAPEPPQLPLQLLPPDMDQNGPSLPPIRKLFPDLAPRAPESAFFFQDPLGNRYSFPPPWPQQEWSCGDQLQREADESLQGR